MLGPENLPYIKFFLNKDPKKLARHYAYYNHCQIVCHNAIWLSCADAGKRALSELQTAVAQNHPEGSNKHYEMNYNDFEMEIILDQVFRDHGITWSMSDDDREKLLDQEAQKKYDNMLKRKRAEMGVVIDE